MANDKMTDEHLVQAIRSGDLPPGVTVADLCDELLRARRASRQDSREAHQLRRMRWTVENMIMKAEGIHEMLVDRGADRGEPPAPTMEDADDRG